MCKIQLQTIGIKMKPRDLYDLCQLEPTEDGLIAVIEVDGIHQQQLDEAVYTRDEDNVWVRDDIPGLTIEDNNDVV